MNPKIKKKKELTKIIEDLKKQGNTIVTTNGTFDLMHYGHVKLLEFAKQQGDILVIGINSDKSVKKYKGKDRPIIKDKYRSEIMASIEYVDYVMIYDDPDCLKFVESMKPNVHVNASTYGYNCIERPIVEKYGGKIELFNIIKGHSTTEIIKKIKGLKK